MDVKKLDAPVETFRIDLRAAGDNRGTIALVWETTEASVPSALLHRNSARFVVPFVSLFSSVGSAVGGDLRPPGPVSGIGRVFYFPPNCCRGDPT